MKVNSHQETTPTGSESPRPRLEIEDPPVVPPPATMTVFHDHRVILFTAGGRPLIRRAGF